MTTHKILQINVVANSGSTGRIVNGIGLLSTKHGYDSWIAYGRGIVKNNSHAIRIGNNWDVFCHGLKTRLLDNHGLNSVNATKEFIKKIDQLNPDIIHLHNIHGYYINYKILFDYLKAWSGPVVWTLHDCWAFTGHCTYYSDVKCNKWQKHCNVCPIRNSYPSSLFNDRSVKNYEDKKRSFLECPNLTIVTVSDWLKKEVSKSFLSHYPIHRIYNGIDLNIFKSKHDSIRSKPLILGVANVWEKRKGLCDFIKLRSILPESVDMVLVGLSKQQIKTLPNNIHGISHTHDINQLVELYSKASVYINCSTEETLGMTTIEAMACGTPVIVYNSTACPEVLSPDTGIIVEPRNINKLKESFEQIISSPQKFTQNQCRERCESLFNDQNCFNGYMELYSKLIKN